MLMFSDVPFVPILALLIIIPLVSWQIYNYWLYRQKNQKPNIPDISKKAPQRLDNRVIKNATLLKNLKPKSKLSRKTSLLFTSAVGVFVLVNLMVLTFYLRNRKLTYLPRADEGITPTTAVLIQTSPNPTATPALTAGPTLLVMAGSPTLPLTTSTPYPTRSITPSPTHSPTLTPTTKISPTTTPKPTVIIGGPYGGSSEVNPTVKPSATPTVKPTVVTAVPSIPATGIGSSSLFLAGLSLVFLIVGLAL